MCSVNINLGPGDCEWYGVDAKYVRQLEALCARYASFGPRFVYSWIERRYGHEFTSGSWWPTERDLMQEQITVTRFTQRPGEVVYVNMGTIHWVKALGATNNVAWNMAPCDPHMYGMAVARFHLNLKIGFQSVMPIVALSWRLLAPQSPVMNDPRVLVRVRAFCENGLEKERRIWAECQRRQVPYVMATKSAAAAEALYCNRCLCEMYAVVFVSSQESTQKKESHAVCYKCSQRTFRQGDTLAVVRRQIADLEDILVGADSRLDELARASMALSTPLLKDESIPGEIEPHLSGPPYV